MSQEVNQEVNQEVVIEEAVEVEDPIRVRVREQMKISSAVSEYIDAKERLERASKIFSESCNDVRDMVSPNTTLVVRVMYGKHYLLTSDHEGNFDVNPIEVI